ncbi:hypothetical protein ACIOGZ_28770 [Kitasatospora sp. NPDC088160]|uniref:hypothetical protein n=1 Tax=Kitasatospora sp. NPDC088160 TaxID=3364072 RepID=UPI0038212A0D
MSAATGPSPVTGDSRVRLHPLQTRSAGDTVIVGRMATGNLIELPPVGGRVIELLGHGLTVQECARRLASESGEDLDVADFVHALAAVGFVDAVDGVPVPGPAPRRPALPWITPRRAAWSLSPALPWTVGLLTAAAVAVVICEPALVPGYRALLWSPHGSLVLLAVFGVGWPLVLLHELAHLVTARATGVPARVELGTRLQFLVAQTDMSGIELAPRRHRLTAYLSGMAVNLVAACVGVLGAAAAGPGPLRTALQILVLLSLLPLAWQFLVFMRTDVYYVLQDFTGSADLYAEGLAYTRYVAARLLPLSRRVPTDPTAGLGPRQRRAARLYSTVLVAGTAACLTALALVTAPTDLALLVRAAAQLGPGHGALERLDGATVLVLLGGAQALWVRTKWRHLRRRRP